MRKLLVVGVLLVALGVVTGVFSVLGFANAAGEGARLERNRAYAEDLLRQSDALSDADPRRQQLLAESAKYATFADQDYESYVEVVAPARFLAASAAVAVLGGGVVLLVHRRRRSHAAEGARSPA